MSNIKERAEKYVKGTGYSWQGDCGTLLPSHPKNIIRDLLAEHKALVDGVNELVEWLGEKSEYVTSKPASAALIIVQGKIQELIKGESGL